MLLGSDIDSGATLAYLLPIIQIIVYMSND